jgi:hypothetical protein
MADESFLVIMLSLCPHPKGRMDARGGWGGGQAPSDTRSWSPILCMPDGPSTKARLSRVGADSLAMKARWSKDNQKQ